MLRCNRRDSEKKMKESERKRLEFLIDSTINRVKNGEIVAFWACQATKGTDLQLDYEPIAKHELQAVLNYDRKFERRSRTAQARSN